MGTALTCLAVALAVLTPGIYRLINHLLGVDNAGRLIAHAMTVWAAAAAQCMLVHWTHPPETAPAAVRQRQIIAVAAVAVMVALFVWADTDEVDIDWIAAHGEKPPVAAYIAVFAGILIYTLTDLKRLSLRYARRVTDRRWTRLGLELFAVGGVFGLGYALIILGYVVAATLDLPYGPGTAWTEVSHAFQLLSIGVIAVGSVLPGTATASTAALRRSREAHQCEQMEPLWRAIVEANPAIAKTQPWSRTPWGRLSAWIASWMGDGRSLSRRVLEIRDGYLQLSPWFDSNVAARAMEHGRQAGLTGSELQAVVEAATVAAALQAKARGDQPVGTGEVEPGGDDLTGEVEWLVRVSRAAQRSPVVAQVLADLQRERDARRGWLERTLDDLGIGKGGE